MSIRTGLVVATVLLLVASACAPAATKSPVVEPLPPRSSSRVMPDLVGKRLDEAADLLDGGPRVVVVVPGYTTSVADASPTPPAAITSAPITVPEVRKVYDGGKMPQLVVSQEPSAGVEISGEATVTLVGGRHPGGDSRSPWMWQHMLAVKEAGSARCFECHQESECSTCHLEVSHMR